MPCLRDRSIPGVLKAPLRPLARQVAEESGAWILEDGSKAGAVKLMSGHQLWHLIQTQTLEIKGLEGLIETNLLDFQVRIRQKPRTSQ